MPVRPGPSTGDIVNSAVAAGFSDAGFAVSSGGGTRQTVDSMFNYTLRTAAVTTVSFPGEDRDWRVKLTLPPGANYFYNDPNNNLLSVLRTEASQVPQGSRTNTQIPSVQSNSRIGVVFPYTPTISVTHTANYTAQKLTHNNYTQYFYENSEVQPISITADFTVQNISEGQYLLASIYFLRSLTKMFFGQDTKAGTAGLPTAGNPPPIVYLNGYGQHYLPNVPCVVTSFQHTMPGDVDYINIPDPSVDTPFSSSSGVPEGTRLPTTSSIVLTVQPVYSRLAQSQMFSLNDFARGALLNNSPTPATAYAKSIGPQFATSGLNGGFL